LGFDNSRFAKSGWPITSFASFCARRFLVEADRLQCIIGTQKHDISKLRPTAFVLRWSVTFTSDCVTPVRRVGSFGNLSHKPSLNLWMANLPARELGDHLDVLVMSGIPDICVRIMH
jgi:hypothetical protein